MKTTSDSMDRPPGRTAQEQTSLSKDEAFMLLKNERRRRVLSILRRESETTLSDLAEEIAATEHDTEPERLTSSERKRVYVSLYQCHLPKLAELGVIEFDSSRGDVVRQPLADELERYLTDDEPAVPDGVPIAGGIVGIAALVATLAAPGLGAVWAAVGGLALLVLSGYLAVAA